MWLNHGDRDDYVGATTINQDLPRYQMRFASLTLQIAPLRNNSSVRAGPVNLVSAPHLSSIIKLHRPIVIMST
ncbi:hypothetical protein E2P81_ATG03660 [Venturia nashicola]|uniref:Uncharacterized protein n=1 Tax=Venturia nashicola TaxID=86259 RepID=A0A4Z1PS26_9PEZI|nr:hypothetical protein E6O75_ATG03735 [Venturia nashicola]TLD37985.1 hypothetical protein E2P81_ATG03660 [Venturia nashicola]